MINLFEYDKEGEITINDSPYSFTVPVDIFFREVEIIKKIVDGE